MRSLVNYHEAGVSLEEVQLERPSPAALLPFSLFPNKALLPHSSHGSKVTFSVFPGSCQLAPSPIQMVISWGRRLTMTFLWGSPKWFPVNLRPLPSRSSLKGVFEMTTLKLHWPQDSLVHQLCRLEYDCKGPWRRMSGSKVVLANSSEVSMKALAVPVHWITLTRLTVV